MSRSRCIGSVMLSLTLGLAPPAYAEIFSVSFSGKGAITFSENPNVPPVGSPVIVSGNVQFGPDGIADRFTGVVPVSLFNPDQSFSYSVDGASIFGDSGAVFGGGSVTFLRGRLVRVSLFADYDSDLSEVSGNRFLGVTGFHSPSGIQEWGGKWALVPEPLAWALMLSGFAAVGGQMRRRSSSAFTRGTMIG